MRQQEPELACWWKWEENHIQVENTVLKSQRKKNPYDFTHVDLNNTNEEREREGDKPRNRFFVIENKLVGARREVGGGMGQLG